ncbi:hypothetical protein PVK06_000028 [Gossypium arboreum]|uniref:Uncharacterized protein n=1 Tax=Gossypium arboreum TaxID=29729 RepID=A0ABR0QYE7_GOSAR|nr:hypothetical protein PVK06_000028 [Gossypium arboreum]
MTAARSCSFTNRQFVPTVFVASPTAKKSSSLSILLKEVVPRLLMSLALMGTLFVAPRDLDAVVAEVDSVVEEEEEVMEAAEEDALSVGRWGIWRGTVDRAAAAAAVVCLVTTVEAPGILQETVQTVIVKSILCSLFKAASFVCFLLMFFFEGLLFIQIFLAFGPLFLTNGNRFRILFFYLKDFEFC